LITRIVSCITGVVRADDSMIQHARSSPSSLMNDNWQQITSDSTLDESYIASCCAHA